MAFVYYTLAGIVLYLVSDTILNWLERQRGGHFPHRSMVFFIIIMILSTVSFQILENLLKE
ncbi:MAG: hypothetical protein G8345_00320 [Magnetococcales bacterium]|nr:hypothetical protein [Magnetococcales bacterium]NGZ25311.1 hypothetical protein [Magnetococcales bacterium]